MYSNIQNPETKSQVLRQFVNFQSKATNLLAEATPAYTSNATNIPNEMKNLPHKYNALTKK